MKNKRGDSQAMIQYRPGPKLGELIDQLATREGLSRGEAAKRLAGLAARGLTIDFYAAVRDLALASTDGQFDQAAEMLVFFLNRTSLTIAMDCNLRRAAAALRQYTRSNAGAAPVVPAKGE